MSSNLREGGKHYDKVILLFFLLGLLIFCTASFADRTYAVQANDFLGKIVSKNYPASNRINSKEQIMVAILRANPEAFQGGNIHFLKRVNSLVLPGKDVTSLIKQSEAVNTIQQHYEFFKQKKTGDFPPIPLKRPIQEANASINTVAPPPRKKGSLKSSIPKSVPIDVEKSISNKAVIQKATETPSNINNRISNSKPDKTVQKKSSSANISSIAKKTITEKPSKELNNIDSTVDRKPFISISPKRNTDEADTPQTVIPPPDISNPIKNAELNKIVQKNTVTVNTVTVNTIATTKKRLPDKKFKGTDSTTNVLSPHYKKSSSNKSVAKKEAKVLSNTNSSLRKIKPTQYGRNKKTARKMLADNPKASEDIIFTKSVTGIGEAGEEVIVYNWPNYIPEGVLDSFTKETGIKVKYSTYNNNEVMYQKQKLLNGSGYDVLISSTYLVERMRDDGLIQTIDPTRLENFKWLDPTLLDQTYDPENQFSIPYLWGSTGIGINTEKLKDTDITRWEDLWHEQWRNQLLLLDDMRQIFGVALKINGHSINSTDPDEIKQAYEKLRGLMSGVKILTNTPHPEFVSGNIDAGITWNADVVLTQKKKPAFQFIYPQEGASFWIESFVIPAMSANVDNALAFIDYMMRPEVAAQCVEALGYATPNLEAIKLLDKKTSENPAIFPERRILRKAEFQKDVGDAKELYLLYWGKLKQMVR